MGDGHLYWVSSFTPVGPREPPVPRPCPWMGSPGPRSFLCSLKLNAPPLRASPRPKTPPSGGWITYTWNPDFRRVSPGPQALLFWGCLRLYTLVVVTPALSLGVVPDIHMNPRLYLRLRWCHLEPRFLTDHRSIPLGFTWISFYPWGNSPSPQAGVTSTQTWSPSWELPGPRS